MGIKSFGQRYTAPRISGDELNPCDVNLERGA